MEHQAVIKRGVWSQNVKGLDVEEGETNWGGASSVRHLVGRNMLDCDQSDCTAESKHAITRIANRRPFNGNDLSVLTDDLTRQPPTARQELWISTGFLHVCAVQLATIGGSKLTCTGNKASAQYDALAKMVRSALVSASGTFRVPLSQEWGIASAVWVVIK